MKEKSISNKKFDPIKGKFTTMDCVLYAIMILMILMIIITLYPFWYVLVVSTSTEVAYYIDPLHILLL